MAGEIVRDAVDYRNLRRSHRPLRSRSWPLRCQCFLLCHPHRRRHLYGSWFELELEKPQPRRALESAMTIAMAYIASGVLPLIPYMFVLTDKKAVLMSVVVTLVVLLFFGYIKGHFTGNRSVNNMV
uniref:Vacuolar iron transporter n=1 Tax=Nelumbo nucifera TaxID=4432 RepID=A0A822YJI9_NELNU|nr:TPA_asm: hypothetical protein HUJ06_011124 [Nelumbo nucifera]